MIVSADLHLTDDSAAVVFDEVLPGLVQAAKDTRCFRIALLGDIYHVRYRVSVRLQNRLLDFLEQSGTCWHLLPGNHDQINASGEHALEVFRELEPVTVFTEPEWDSYGLWLPYRKNLEDIAKALDIPRPEGSPPVAWMHHGVQGAFMNTAARDTTGIPMARLGEFERVICGHYHLPQDLGFLSYVGSPYQTRADESAQQKRYGLWQGGGMTWYPVDWGRKYHRLLVGPDQMPDLSGAAKDDEIRIQVEGQDSEAVGKVLAGQGFTNVVVTPIQKAAQSRLQVDPGKGLGTYAQSYVEQFAEGLDQERLMNLYREIVG